MVRNIVVLGGNSHPTLTQNICNILEVPECNRLLTKFSVGESRCEIKDSVRGKDVYIIQTASGKVNDNFIDLCIMISACKTGSARRVTAVLPLFPYSRQPDLPYTKTGAPLSKATLNNNGADYTFESVPSTPGPVAPGLQKTLSTDGSTPIARHILGHSNRNGAQSTDYTGGAVPTAKYHEKPGKVTSIEPNPGYKQWIAQPGALVADLLTCAGADHILTMDLHDSQFQGFFDKPVDNLYSRMLLQRYISEQIEHYQDAVIVSPDAGGAKRATAIADNLGLDFALIHKERRPMKITDRQNATMMLVGNVDQRVCILVDDLVDTGNTITRAAKILKNEGATAVYALITHGIFSGDALERVARSAIDKVVVTNTVPQVAHEARLGPRLEVLDISPTFAEACRRVHFGESLSVLF